MLLRVVWGLGETMETFCPMKRLSRVDLPALVGTEHDHMAKVLRVFSKGCSRGAVGWAAFEIVRKSCVRGPKGRSSPPRGKRQPLPWPPGVAIARLPWERTL